MKLCPPLIFDTSKVLDGTVIVFIPFLHQALLNADHTYKLFQIFQSMKNIRIRFVRSIYECLLQLFIVTITSFALILIEVVIVLGIMVLISYSIVHTTDSSGMMFEEQ